MNASIPAFLIEEHHEAFLIWHYALQRGAIPAKGNILLHIDEHGGLGTPRLGRSLESLGSELREIAEFTYNELDIGSFVWPAAYLGIVGEYHWMRHDNALEVPPRNLYIRPANETRTEFITGLEDGSATAGMLCSRITTGSTFKQSTSVILDIDLDYFCCNRYPDLGCRRIEVTHATWNDFIENRYHFLRLAPGRRISATQEDGRYFFSFEQSLDIARTEADHAREAWDIMSRLERLIGFLERNQVQPRLITTCRSRHSGYTPAEHCDSIERAVWDRLTHRYGCKPVTISQVLDEL